MRIFISLLLILVFCAPVQADKVSPYKPPTAFEESEDFFIIEGAGLFPSGYEDALNIDMWDGSRRDEITELLKKLPVNSESIAVQDLVRSLLLSENNTEELKNYKDVKPGEDLLTLRIYKLIEGGFYEDALELYSVAVETPHHEAIAKAGILAMLGSGEKSIACLEMKTLGHVESDDDFWSVFEAYCDYTLSDTPSEAAQSILEDTRFEILRSLAFNDSFIFPYSIKDWGNLHILEQNVLIAENKIEAPVLDAGLLNSIPARDVAALLTLETLPEKDYIALMVKARSYGLVSVKDLADAYDGVKNDALLGGLIGIYHDLSDADNEDMHRDTFDKVLTLYDDQGVHAISPFSDFLQYADLDKVSDADMRKLLRIFYAAGVENADKITRIYTQNGPYNLENRSFLENVKAITMVFNMPTSHNFVKNMQNIGIFHKNTHDLVEFNIEQLDNPASDVDNAAKVYEKDVDAAVQKRQEDLLKQLKSTSRNNALGETALLSIYLLSEYAPHQVDDNVYSDISDALKKVELKEFLRKMAIERLIGDETGRS